MKPKEVEELCKKLKPIIKDKADKLWHFYLAEDYKGRQELEQTIEILAEKYLKKHPLENQQILLPPPAEEDSQGKYLLGDVIYNNKKLQPLCLHDEDFQKQIGLFGITGEGKTNLAYLLALQLSKNKIPWFVIDWKRSWRNLLSLKDKYSELKNVQVFTIGRDTLPFLWNPFRPPPGADKQQWISTIAEVLEKSHLSGPGVTSYLNRIFGKLVKSVSDNDNFYPNFYDGLMELKNIKASHRELQWLQSTRRIFQSFTIGKASKAFNARNPIKIEDLLDKPFILELDMEMPKALRVFLSEIILRWIHLYRLNQGETEDLRHVLFNEEVHNFFNDSGLYKETNSLENVYREIRAFGQGIVSITQHPSMLPVYLLGNCHTQVYFGLQHSDDIRTAKKSLFLKYGEEEYPNLLNVGECIVKVKNRVEPCLVKTPLVDVKKGIVNSDWLKMHNLGSQFQEYSWSGEQGKKNFNSLKKNIRDILKGNKVALPVIEKKHSTEKIKCPSESDLNTPGYLRHQLASNALVSERKKTNKIPKAGVETSVNIKNKKVKYPPKTKPHYRLLIDIFESPFSSIIERYDRLKLNPYYGNSFRKKLISEKCVQPRKIITGSGWITLFELTQKGKMVLRDLGANVKNESEGIVHRFWKAQIAEFYKKQGLDVRIEEYYKNGRPDIIVRKDGKNIAIEVETGKSDFVKNIRQGLEAGFDEIICVAVNRFIEGKIRGELERLGIQNERVRVVGVKGFL